MNPVSVHKYKYSQESRRKILKKMWKQGLIEYKGQTKTHHHYIVPIESVEEYKKKN